MLKKSSSRAVSQVAEWCPNCGFLLDNHLVEHVAEDSGKACELRPPADVVREAQERKALAKERRT